MSAFIAIKVDGRVVTWGWPEASADVKDALENSPVIAIY